MRTVKTSPGATAAQIVYSSRRGSCEIDHLGSARSGAEVELLKAAARQRVIAGPLAGTLRAGQLLQDRTGTRPLPAPAPGRPVRVRSLPDLRQVRHCPSLRAAAPRAPAPGVRARRRCLATRPGPRGRPPSAHRQPGPRPAHRAGPILRPVGRHVVTFAGRICVRCWSAPLGPRAGQSPPPLSDGRPRR